MIHQSKFFVCPGQNYGISWNICISRQCREFKGCQTCAYKNWQEKGGLQFNPYAGAFAEGQELVDIEDDEFRYPDPSKVRVYSAEPRRFMPEDIGLEDKNTNTKKSWLKKLYDAI